MTYVDIGDGITALEINENVGISIPISPNTFDRNVGSIGVWFMSNNGYVAFDEDFPIFEIYIDANNWWKLYWDVAVQRIAFQINIGGNLYSSDMPCLFNETQKHFIGGYWNKREVCVWFDSEYGTPIEIPDLAPAGNAPTVAHLFTDHLGNPSLTDGYVWSFFILNVNYPEIISRVYNIRRNLRLADFLFLRKRRLWYGSRYSEPRYRLGN